MTSIDPATRTLLVFIGAKETDGHGNYNAVIGEPNAKDPLSQYDIEDIYNLQADLRAARRPSTAVGLYQFVHSTLLQLQQKSKLPLSTRFTPELQDALAVQLLVTRGYSRWWRGKLSDDEFAHALSCEWASLPDPYNDGRSHYDGLAGNHAGWTLDEFYECLAAVRKLIPA